MDGSQISNSDVMQIIEDEDENSGQIPLGDINKK
jgi:hypothetical protein